MPRNYSEGQLSKWTAETYTWGVVMVGNKPVYQVVQTTPSNGNGGYGVYRSRTFSGSVTMDFKSVRKALGYLPTRACTDTVLFRVSNPYVYNLRMSDGSGRVIYTKRSSGEGSHPTNKNASSPELTELYNIAWSKLRMKVLAQDFNAPIFFAELGRSVQMIVNTARRVYDAYLAFRKGRLKLVAAHLGLTKSTVHNTWLEYKYGWMPMLQDIHGAMLAMANIKYGPRRHHFTAMKTRTMPVVEAGYDGKFSLKAKAWVYLQLGNPTTDTANRIGLLNPLSVLWEITPFSFIGDWFVNVGSFIQEMSAFAGVTILDGGSSRLSACNATYRASMGTFQDGNMGSTVSQQRSYARTAGTQTIPTLRRKENPFGTVASLVRFEKSLTTLSLIRQKFMTETPPLPPRRDKRGNLW